MKQIFFFVIMLSHQKKKNVLLRSAVGNKHADTYIYNRIVNSDPGHNAINFEGDFPILL